MKGIIVMKGLTDIDEKYIQAAILPEVESGKAGKTGKPKKEKRVGSFLNSGWAAACICLVVGIVVYLAVLGLGAGKFDRLFGHGSEVTATREDPTDTTSVLESDTKPDTEAESEITTDTEDMTEPEPETETEPVPDLPAYEPTNGLEYEEDEVNHTYTVTHAPGAREVFIPDTAFGQPVTAVGANAFTASTTSVTIPYTVTDIAVCAFTNCIKLENITVSPRNPKYCVQDGCLIDRDTHTLIAGCMGCVIPSDVTAIAPYAISVREGVQSLTIPAGVTQIGEAAFSACPSQTDIRVDVGNTAYRAEGGCLIDNRTHTVIYGTGKSVLPSDVTAIGSKAFMGSIDLYSLVIPDGVTEIGDYAFSGCALLSSLIIPGSVKTIGAYAFQYCSGLRSVTLGEGIVTIGESAFYRCGRWEELIIPEGVTSIGYGAFNETELTVVTIPESVKKIDVDAFRQSDFNPTFTVIYTGTAAQWKAIDKNEYWNNRNTNCTVHCTDGDA